MLSIHYLRLHGWFKASWSMAVNSFCLLLWQKFKGNELQFDLDTPARCLTPFVEFIRSRWHFKLNRSSSSFVKSVMLGHFRSPPKVTSFETLQEKNLHSSLTLKNISWCQFYMSWYWGGPAATIPPPETLPSRSESRLMWNEHFHETVWWMSVCDVVALWLIISPMMND